MRLKKLFSDASKAYYLDSAIKNWDSINARLGPQISGKEKSGGNLKHMLLRLCSLFLLLTLATASFLVLTDISGTKKSPGNLNSNINGTLFYSDGGSIKDDTFGYNPYLPEFLVYQDTVYFAEASGNDFEKTVYSPEDLLGEINYSGIDLQLYSIKGYDSKQKICLFYPLDDNYNDVENYDTEKGGVIFIYSYFCGDIININGSEFPIYFGDDISEDDDFSFLSLSGVGWLHIPDSFYRLKNVTNDSYYSGSPIDYKLVTLDSGTDIFKLKKVDYKDCVLLENGGYRVLLLRKGLKF